jgi:hypothetical protein
VSTRYARPQFSSKKYLTNENFTQLLRTIALTKQPKSSYEIKYEMKKYDQRDSSGNYVYEMIKLLVQKRRKDNLFLFNINGVLEDRHRQKEISTVLNKRFNFGWSDKDIESGCIKFTRIKDDGIEIEHISNSKTVVIRLILNSSASGMLEIIGEDGRRNIFPLTYHNSPEFNANPGDVYLNKVYIGMKERPERDSLDRYFRPTVDYLDVVLEKKYRHVVAKNETRVEEIVSLDKRRAKEGKHRVYARGSFLKDEEKKEIKRLVAESEKIKNDERKWRYDLNIRGFILYVLGEINLENKGRRHNKRISEILQYIQRFKADKYKFPFLIFYTTFREIYKQLEDDKRLPKYYEVELLKKIALELQFLVHTADMELLNYWVTRRFSGEITYYLLAAEGVLSNFTDERISAICDYQITNLQAMNRYLSNEKQKVEGSLKELPDYQSNAKDLQIYF